VVKEAWEQFSSSVHRGDACVRLVPSRPSGGACARGKNPGGVRNLTARSSGKRLLSIFPQLMNGWERSPSFGKSMEYSKGPKSKHGHLSAIRSTHFTAFARYNKCIWMEGRECIHGMVMDNGGDGGPMRSSQRALSSINILPPPISLPRLLFIFVVDATWLHHRVPYAAIYESNGTYHLITPPDTFPRAIGSDTVSIRYIYPSGTQLQPSCHISMQTL
jgi:hypothetical protein